MSKIITRKYIQRITKREGDTSIRRNSGGGGGGGGVSQYWVDDNYVSKEFFNRLFEIHDENGDPILPNDVETEIDNIQAMFGFWTNAYLSALGQNEGGGGVELTLASLADVNVQGVTDGQALVWSAAQGKWVPGEGGGGLDPTAMWAELATTGTQQINKTHLTTALADYLPLTGGTMTSTSLVTNMNADLLDGHHATDFALASAITDMATQTWVSTNYLSKTDATSTYLTKTEANTTYLSISFFRALFRAYTSGGSEVVPNDGSTSTIDNIKAMFGFWTNSYLSALGNNPGGASLTLSSLSDVSISGVTAGQVLTYRNGTWRNETPQGGGGSVTSIVTGGTTYSPTNGVVTLPDYIVYTNENQSYLNASFLKAEYSQKAAQEYIEFWDSTGGWFNFKLGTLYAVNDVKVGNNSVIHAGNIGSQSVSYATTAGSVNKLQTARTIWGQSFDGTSNVSGSLIGVTSIEMNSDGALSGFGGFIDFHFSGSSADYTSRIIEDASGRVSINSVLYAQYGGNVGIGTTPSSNHKLYVSGTFYASGNSSIGGTLGVTGATSLSSTLGVSGATTLSSTLGVTGATTLSSTLSVSGTSTLTGHVGIGTTPHSTYVLRADGEVYVSTGLYSHGYVTALSDIRHKDIQGDVGLTVNEVANAPAVKFLWKDRRKEGLQVGSIAQYWKKVLPEAIVEAADGELTMSYGVVALLASIANAREIVNLKREIAELKRKLQKHGILE